MVYLLLEDGFEMCEALCPVDILRRGGVEVMTVGATKRSVTSSHGVEITADLDFSDISISDMEMLIIPGGQPGVDNLWENEDVRKLILDVSEKGTKISAICAAPIILSRLGLLEGKESVCYPSYGEELVCKKYLADTGIACDGDIITGRAAGDALDFSFEILRVLRGKEIALEVRRAICYE